MRKDNLPVAGNPVRLDALRKKLGPDPLLLSAVDVLEKILQDSDSGQARDPSHVRVSVS